MANKFLLLALCTKDCIKSVQLPVENSQFIILFSLQLYSASLIASATISTPNTCLQCYYIFDKMKIMLLTEFNKFL